MDQARLRLVVAVARGVSQARTDVAAIAGVVAQAFTRELADGTIVVLEAPSAIVRSDHRRPAAGDSLRALASADPAALPGLDVVAAGGARLVPASSAASAAWQAHARRFPPHDLLVAPIRTADACLGRIVLIRDQAAQALPDGGPFRGDDVDAVVECLEHVTLALEHAIATHAMKALVEERKRAEAERAVLDAILEATPAGIIIADAQGRLVRFNPANELLWGPAPRSGSVDEYREWKGWWADQSERRGRRVEPHEWAMARALRGEMARDDIVEIEPFDAPGTRRTMVNRGAAVRDAGGRIMGAVVAQMDISALVTAQEALREADRRKDEFMAILAHELRNPLAPVSHALEIMRRVRTTDPWIERTRDVIERQVRHMARLIDDLLDVSRIARGKLLLQTETCDLAAIARQTAEDHRATLESAGLTLRAPTASDAVWIEGDPVRLAQMIGNLLHNAQRFTGQGGVVEVRTEIEAGSRLAVVSVTDTGVGMDPALLSRLFDPFSQAVQDLARSKGGLGLGLALTKGLAELHGGGVAARSDGPGRGSTFAVRIPLSKARHAPAPAPATEHGGGRLRILVVEDNEDAAETLGDLLELGGHEVELAFDGASAVAAARERQPDVVISDIGLPGELDGYGVARTLRAEPTLEGVYLIALSGYANEDARRRAREAGFDAHFAKPPDIARLEQALADAGDRAAAIAAS